MCLYHEVSLCARLRDALKDKLDKSSYSNARMEKIFSGDH